MSTFSLPFPRQFRRKHALLCALLTAAALLALQLAFPDPVPTPADIVVQETPSARGVVSRVVDGDTLVVTVGGKEEKIRMIGINAPESVDPRKPVECFGKEASAHMKALAEGRPVHLEADGTQDDRDKYGRLLRYVTVEGAVTSLNELQIRDGFAQEYTYSKPYLRQALFLAAEEESRREKRGLWADDACLK